MKQNLILFLSTILFFSCDVFETHYYDSDSFVLGYLEAKNIEILELYPIDNKKIVSVVCLGGGLYTFNEQFSKRCTDPEKFHRLCEKHNDFLPEKRRVKYVTPGIGFSEEPWATDMDLVSVNITSIDVYDENHPVGTSLNDIVRFSGITPYRYIKSGYKKKFDYSTVDLSRSFTSHYFGESFKGESEHYPIDKMVNTLTPEDMILLVDVGDGVGNGVPMFFLCFEQPAASYPQHIKVEITTDDGRTFVSNELEIQ